MSDSIRPFPSPIALIATVIAALTVGFGLGVVAYGDNVLRVDLDLTTAIQQTQGSGIRMIADIANVLGSTAGASVITGIAIVIAAVRKAKWELVFLVTLLALRLLGTQLKPLFDSPRPTDDHAILIATFDGTGYPSGHALTASTVALAISTIAWRRIPPRTWAAGIIVASMAMALVIGWARIWSGAHWATDVIGGYAFGVAIVAASAFVPGWVADRPTGRRFLQADP